jgi:hypothetical protein
MSPIGILANNSAERDKKKTSNNKPHVTWDEE